MLLPEMLSPGDSLSFVFVYFKNCDKIYTIVFWSKSSLRFFRKILVRYHSNLSGAVQGIAVP